MHTSTTSTVPLEPWTIEQLQQATHGYWLNDKKHEGKIKRILTDSRHAEAGMLFWHLKVSVLMRMTLSLKWLRRAVESRLSANLLTQIFVS